MKILIHCWTAARFLITFSLAQTEVIVRPVGSNVTLVPKYSGDPTTIQWNLGGNRLVNIDLRTSAVVISNHLRSRADIDHSNGCLTIMNLTTTDSGEYKAEVVVNYMFQFTKIRLTVLDQVSKPTIQDQSTKEQIIVSCETFTPGVTYKWRDNNNEIVSMQQRYTIPRSEQSLTLTCIVNNNISEESTSITIPYVPESNGLSGDVIAVIIVLVVALGIVVAALIWRCKCKKNQRNAQLRTQLPEQIGSTARNSPHQPDTRRSRTYHNTGGGHNTGFGIVIQEKEELHMSQGETACIVRTIMEDPNRPIQSYYWEFQSSSDLPPIRLKNSKRVTATRDFLKMSSVTFSDAGIYTFRVQDRNITYMGNRTHLSVTATPKVTLTEDIENHLLIFKAKWFYPPELDISWSVSPGADQIQETLIKNKDGTFSKTSILTLVEEIQEQNISCDVSHCTLCTTRYRYGAWTEEEQDEIVSEVVDGVLPLLSGENSLNSV